MCAQRFSNSKSLDFDDEEESDLAFDDEEDDDGAAPAEAAASGAGEAAATTARVKVGDWSVEQVCDWLLSLGDAVRLFDVVAVFS